MVKQKAKQKAEKERLRQQLVKRIRIENFIQEAEARGETIDILLSRVQEMRSEGVFISLNPVRIIKRERAMAKLIRVSAYLLNLNKEALEVLSSGKLLCD